MPREPLTPEQQHNVSEAMRHVHPAYDRELEFERIAINQGALCIERKACVRRVVGQFECVRLDGRGKESDAVPYCNACLPTKITSLGCVTRC
jgi:hypothetical protein